jgi:hypothetical protein
MLAKRTGFILVGILAMVSLGILAGSRITSTEAGGEVKVAYAVLVKQAPFKTAGLVILDKATATKMKVSFSAYNVTHKGAHPAHIHNRLAGAKCAAGAVVVNLTPAPANANGVVSFTRSITGKVGDQVGKVVVLHDLDGTYMACGPIKAAG